MTFWRGNQPSLYSVLRFAIPFLPSLTACNREHTQCNHVQENVLQVFSIELSGFASAKVGNWTTKNSFLSWQYSLLCVCVSLQNNININESGVVVQCVVLSGSPLISRYM